MDEDMIADLKQFIASQMAQQLASIREDITRVENKLERKIDDLSSAVAEALDNSNEVTESQLKDHELRIVKLERTAA